MKKLKTIGAMCIVIFVVLIPTALSYQDDEYIAWFTEKGERLNFYLEMVGEAGNDKDWVSAKSYSDLSYNLCADILDEIDEFDISPGYLSKVKDEQKAGFQDMKWAAYYSKNAADALLSGDGGSCKENIKFGESYAESAEKHWDKASEYLGKYQEEWQEEFIEKYIEESENAPSSTSKKIPTPKPTASIFIDSDSDGLPDEYDYDPYDPNIKSQSDFILIWLGTSVVIAAIIVVAYLMIGIKSKIK